MLGLRTLQKPYKGLTGPQGQLNSAVPLQQLQNGSYQPNKEKELSSEALTQHV